MPFIYVPFSSLLFIVIRLSVYNFYLKMSFLSLFRNPAVLGAINISTLLGVGGGTYILRSHMIELSEDHEARMVRSQSFPCFLHFSCLCQNW